MGLSGPDRLAASTLLDFGARSTNNYVTSEYLISKLLKNVLRALTRVALAESNLALALPTPFTLSQLRGGAGFFSTLLGACAC